MDRSEPRALADRHDRLLDEADDEERLALARTPERDDGASALQVPRCRVRNLFGTGAECDGLSRRRVVVVVKDQDVRRSLVPGRGDRQRAVVTSEEGVRGGAATVVLRAAREL